MLYVCGKWKTSTKKETGFDERLQSQIENTTSLPPTNFWNFAEANLKIWDVYIRYKAYLKPR